MIEPRTLVLVPLLPGVPWTLSGTSTALMATALSSAAGRAGIARISRCRWTPTGDCRLHVRSRWNCAAGQRLQTGRALGSTRMMPHAP